MSNLLPEPSVPLNVFPTAQPQTVRRQLARYLEGMDTTIGLGINGAIAGLVLLSVSLFIAETYALPSDWRSVLQKVDCGILILFSLEYLLRLWCAEHRLRYIFSLQAVIDLMAILPFFLGIADIRFLLILRWFRILRLLRFMGRETLMIHPPVIQKSIIQESITQESITQKSITQEIINSGTDHLREKSTNLNGLEIFTEENLILARIIFTLIAIMLISSGLIYQVEHPIHPEVFRNFFDAFYFSVVTMTTVGFGDILPDSDGGHLVTVLMIMAGIIFIPWQVEDLVKTLLRSSNKPNNQKLKPCPGCGLLSHDLDALFCKICGTSLVGQAPFLSSSDRD